MKCPGLRKNSLLIAISDNKECCKKKCLQGSISHLHKVRSEFQALFYEHQNVYLHGLLHRRETK